MADEAPDLDTPGGRLAWARARAGYTDAAQFARAMKRKPVTYRAYEANQNQFARHAPEFAERLAVPTNWLLRGGPLPETEPPDPPAPGEFGTPEVLQEHDIELVRQVDISYAMGDGAVIDDYPETGFLPFDRTQLQKIARGPRDKLFVARGHGDSMFPTLLADDLILVDGAQNQVREQDRLWALSYAGAGMVKRLRRLPGDRYLILSDNPAIPPQEADNDDVHVVGRVVWMARNMA